MKLLLLPVILGSITTALANPLCPTTDAILIIDSSQSITKEQFANIKTYASNFVSTFSVGSGDGQAQFAGILFNEAVAVQWHLNDYNNLQDLQAYIAQLPYITGTTNTANAFTRAGDLLGGQGARQTCKGIVLFTDGHNDYGENPVPIADQLRAAGVTILSVGIPGIYGNTISYDYDKLVQISGDPNLVFGMNSTTAAQMEGTKLQMKTALLHAGRAKQQ